MNTFFKPVFGMMLLGAGVALALPSASLADVYVIANPAATVSAGDIKDIYLGEKQMSGSTKLVPVDNSAAQAEFLVGSERDWNAGVGFNYAILNGGAIAGSAGLMARIGPGGLEIGYWVHRAFTRRGLATAASAALVEQAFRLPGVDRVEIVHDELNVASGGVPRKLGFTEVERRPLEELSPGGSGIGVIWRLTR